MAVGAVHDNGRAYKEIVCVCVCRARKPAAAGVLAPIPARHNLQREKASFWREDLHRVTLTHTCLPLTCYGSIFPSKLFNCVQKQGKYRGSNTSTLFCQQLIMATDTDELGSARFWIL